MPTSPEAIGNWATHFLHRYQGVRASVHAMRVELEQKAAANPSSSSIKKLEREREALAQAFAALDAATKPAVEPFDPYADKPRRRSGEVAT